ncbi:MAG: hypothetical protein N2439_17115 [Anaerolineae bacterium]|nr:hypothetical protein [Anaerolineae bacterium]
MDIHPIKVKDLPAFLSAVEPIAREIAQGDILAALARHADAVIAATAIGAGVSREWLEDQDVDTLVDMAACVMEVNADFFARRVLPRIAAAAETLGRIGSGGTASSPALSGPDSPIGT